MDFSNAALLPYVTLDPDWRIIFKGDKVSLTCNVIYSVGWKEEEKEEEQRFRWYKDNQLVDIYEPTFQIKSAEIRHSGSYQCKTTTGPRSDPVQLEVSNDWLILQAPVYIHEEDRLTLNCRGWDALFSNGVTIYKDNRKIGNMGYCMDKTDNGVYHCKRRRLMFPYTSQGVSVLVHDLFSVPVLRLTPPSVLEGDEMALTCHTALAPRRFSSTQLHFAFYRNEQKVQDFSPSDEYRVSPAQLGHSGKYSCDVKTLSGIVRKTSDPLSLQVEEVLMAPVLQVFPSASVRRGEQVILQCVTSSPTGSRLLYSFHRAAAIVRQYTANNTYIIPEAEEDDSGYYQCASITQDNKGLKFSKVVDIAVKGPFDNGGLRKVETESGFAVEQPRLAISPDNAAVGDEVTLRCESSGGLPPIHYRFYHNGTLLGNVTVYQERRGELTQVIRSAAMTGPYHCDCRNDMAPMARPSEVVTVLIVDPVDDISVTTDSSEEDYVIGHQVTFTCSVQRGSSPSFLWLHNEDVIEEGSVFYRLTDDRKRLYIDSLQSHHRGTYRCKASNTLPPNRTFSALSAPWTINDLEPSPAAGSSVLFTVLGVVLLTVLAAALGVMYRHNVASLFRSRARQQLKTETTKEQARITKKPASSVDDGQEDYIYINASSRNLAVCEDEVCYSQVTSSQMKEASSPPGKSSEEFSVTYSALTFSQPTTDPEVTGVRADSTDLYQNLHPPGVQC
ncbi:Fc receptor-like protein 3 [Dendropsophus ebraccatus]|uniref:Fc receptor-like protein 3 n=1 Tax=Dendropsophus ebraccatus TaxID=150705 RepID=UPI0038322220